MKQVYLLILNISSCHHIDLSNQTTHITSFCVILIKQKQSYVGKSYNSLELCLLLSKSVIILRTDIF